jgi:acyl carrier protein
MTVSQDTLDRVKVVIVKTLQIQDRADRLDEFTELFGSMPELDSMSVVALAVNLEREFDFEIDDEDFRGEVFETIGTLAEFVEQQRSTGGGA